MPKIKKSNQEKELQTVPEAPRVLPRGNPLASFLCVAKACLCSLARGHTPRRAVPSNSLPLTICLGDGCRQGAGVSLWFHCTMVAQAMPAPHRRDPGRALPHGPEDLCDASHRDTGAGPSGPVASRPRQSSGLWHPTQRDSSCPSLCPLLAPAGGRSRGRRGHRPGGSGPQSLPAPSSLYGSSGHARLLISVCHRDARGGLDE